MTGQHHSKLSGSVDVSDALALLQVQVLGGPPHPLGLECAFGGAGVLEKFKQIAGRPPKHAIFLQHGQSLQCLEERALGMKDVYGAAGTKFTKVACKFDPVITQETVRAFIQSNPDVETVHSGCSQVSHWAAGILKQLGRLGTAKVAVVGIAKRN